MLGADRPPAALRLLVGSLVAVLLGGGSSTTLGLMNNEQRMPTGLVVTIGFTVVLVIAVGIVLVARQFPSEEQLCSERCAQYSKRGELVYTYPPELTAGMRGKDPRECRCA